MDRKLIKYGKHALWIALLASIIWTAHHYELAKYIEHVQSSLNGYAPSPLILVGLMALAIVVVPIPSSPISLSAGILYGPFWGTLYSVIGAEIGALVAFLIARGLGKDWIYAVFKKDLVFCQQCTTRYLTWTIFTLRLIPFMQFDVVSYGAGLTAIPLRNYAFATFIGLIPATFLEVAVGASFGLNTIGLVLALVTMGLITLAPVIINRTNVFGLKKYIFHKPHLENGKLRS